jgi:hypothetical protein
MNNILREASFIEPEVNNILSEGTNISTEVENIFCEVNNRGSEMKVILSEVNIIWAEGNNIPNKASSSASKYRFLRLSVKRLRTIVKTGSTSQAGMEAIHGTRQRLTAELHLAFAIG